MSADSHESRPGVANTARLPGALDAWRMVAARRGFEGTLPLSSMERLREVLCDTEGEIGYVIAFDRDALQVPYVELRVPAALDRKSVGVGKECVSTCRSRWTRYH